MNRSATCENQENKEVRTWNAFNSIKRGSVAALVEAIISIRFPSKRLAASQGGPQPIYFTRTRNEKAYVSI